MAKRPDVGDLGHLLSAVAKDYRISINAAARLLLVEGAKSLGYNECPEQVWFRSGLDLVSGNEQVQTRPGSGLVQVQNRSGSGQTSTGTPETPRSTDLFPLSTVSTKGSTSTTSYQDLGPGSAEHIALAERQVEALLALSREGKRHDGSRMAKSTVKVCRQAASYGQARGGQVAIVQRALGYPTFGEFYNHTKVLLLEQNEPNPTQEDA